MTRLKQIPQIKKRNIVASFIQKRAFRIVILSPLTIFKIELEFWKNILDSLLENKKKISNDNMDLDFEVDLEESFFLINLQVINFSYDILTNHSGLFKTP